MTILGADGRNQQIIAGRKIFDVKSGRFVDKLASAHAFAGKSEVANIFDAQIDERHPFQLMWRTILEQETIARLIVDEFPRAVPFAKIFFSKRLASNKFGHFVEGKEIVAIVDRFVANADSRHEILKMIWSAFDEDIGSVKQIGVDVARDNFFVTVEDDFGLGDGCGTETDDNAVDVRLLSRFAVPTESSVSKVNVHVVEKWTPERGNRIALTNRVSGDKSGAEIFSPTTVSGFFIPAGNIIEVADVLPAVKNRVDVRFLRGVHDSCADEGRVSDDEVWLRTDILPVELKSVAFENVAVAF